MRLPKWLIVALTLLVLLIFADFIIGRFYEEFPIGDINNLILGLTLVVVIFYVYYTYVLAKDTMTPSASFTLQPYPHAQYHFLFLIQNHSRLSLQCWCNLNLIVCGSSVHLDGFYGGNSSFDIQPFGAANGHFDLNDFINRAGHTSQELAAMSNDENAKDQLRMNVDFWYMPHRSRMVIHNPCQPHYFDFRNNTLVLDF